ncbi:MAG TPA: hypothetical protein EYP33_01030 [Pyrodictium sp.]|nr:hypothetical protein [Pyrodictium sp.]
MEAKCIEYDVPIVYVDPRNISETCKRCGFKADRNTVSTMNI